MYIHSLGLHIIIFIKVREDQEVIVKRIPQGQRITQITSLIISAFS